MRAQQRAQRIEERTECTVVVRVQSTRCLFVTYRKLYKLVYNILLIIDKILDQRFQINVNLTWLDINRILHSSYKYFKSFQNHFISTG